MSQSKVVDIPVALSCSPLETVQSVETIMYNSYTVLVVHDLFECRNISTTDTPWK